MIIWPFLLWGLNKDMIIAHTTFFHWQIWMQRLLYLFISHHVIDCISIIVHSWQKKKEREKNDATEVQTFSFCKTFHNKNNLLLLVIAGLSVENLYFQILDITHTQTDNSDLFLFSSSINRTGYNFPKYHGPLEVQLIIVWNGPELC